MTKIEPTVYLEERTVLCDNCGEVPALETHIDRKTQSFEFRRDKVEIEGKVRICNRCQDEVYDRDLDESLVTHALYTYRSQHHLLSPQDIREIRERYGLSQRGLASLLGMGEITIHRYESGSLPDEAQNQLLRLIADPLNMRRLLLENGHRLPPSARERLQVRVGEILKEKSTEMAADVLQAGTAMGEFAQGQRNGRKGVIRVPGRVRDSFLRTGGRPFSPQILMEMILFFAAKPGGVLKTKVNKLLWYADFEHFRRFGASISGSVYVHEAFGPVAHGYWLYLAQLAEENRLDIREQTYDNTDWVAELLVARAHAQNSLPPSAKEVMQTVYERFQNVGSRAISDISHQERAYLETESKQEISYSYARDLYQKFET